MCSELEGHVRTYNLRPLVSVGTSSSAHVTAAFVEAEAEAAPAPSSEEPSASQTPSSSPGSSRGSLCIGPSDPVVRRENFARTPSHAFRQDVTVKAFV
mmetsp:Transcript_94553/g.206973  ORF Transcript_94553/g.206973 Transcript_94553/m.206973 type:complete len:98 (+) Transcript_94553:296-589(+)